MAQSLKAGVGSGSLNRTHVGCGTPPKSPLDPTVSLQGAERHPTTSLGATSIPRDYYLVCYPFRAPECIKLNAAIFRFTLVLSDLNVFT